MSKDERALEIVRRRRWFAFPADDGWIVLDDDQNVIVENVSLDDFEEMLFRRADPAESLCAADDWYREHIEKETP